MENINCHHYFKHNVEAQKYVEVAPTFVVRLNGRVWFDQVLKIAHKELNLVLYLDHVEGGKVPGGLVLRQTLVVLRDAFHLHPCVDDFVVHRVSLLAPIGVGISTIRILEDQPLLGG